jgi:MoxR-vWA-beta-propeller ternary system domain bpX2
MPTPLDDAGCACLPLDGLPHLGVLRGRADVRVLVRAGLVWAYWPPGDANVARLLLALAGAQLFCRRAGLWYRPGQCLPTFDVPGEDGAEPLAHVLFPAPVRPEVSTDRTWKPASLALVRDECPRPTTALRCSLADLAAWADNATSQQLARLEAALGDRAVLLRGERLPPLVGSERFWGRAVLVPLGHRPEPALAEGVLAAALELDAGEVAVLGAVIERVPSSAFGPVTRVGARLALRGAGS